MTAKANLTPAMQERLLAWLAVPSPWWVGAAGWVLFAVPGCRCLGERLVRWDSRRSVRIYRARSAVASSPSGSGAGPRSGGDNGAAGLGAPARLGPAVPTSNSRHRGAHPGPAGDGHAVRAHEGR